MTNGGRWRTAFASSIGTSHEKRGDPCQDASGIRIIELADGQEVLIAAVSDGAGTAERSDIGSRLVVARFLEDFGDAMCDGLTLDLPSEDFARRWFKSLVTMLEDTAETLEHDIRDYSCTLLGAVLGPASSLYVQLGDGAIVVSTEDGEDYAWVFWPQHGEYANSTYFVTQTGVETLLQVEAGRAVDEVAIFSDGLERLVLNIRDRAVHAPAFRPIFEWLAATDQDSSGLASPVIEAYLASELVNRRTDDDKSLVMATRRPAPELQDAATAV